MDCLNHRDDDIQCSRDAQETQGDGHRPLLQTNESDNEDGEFHAPVDDTPVPDALAVVIVSNTLISQSTACAADLVTESRLMEEEAGVLLAMQLRSANDQTTPEARRRFEAKQLESKAELLSGIARIFKQKAIMLIGGAIEDRSVILEYKEYITEVVGSWYHESAGLRALFDLKFAHCNVWQRILRLVGLWWLLDAGGEIEDAMHTIESHLRDMLF